MKRQLLIVSLFVGFISHCLAQIENDRIVFKNGDIVNCKISDVDTSAYTIYYTQIKSSILKVASLNTIESYTWGGISSSGLLENNQIMDREATTPGTHFIEFSNQAQSGLAFMFAGVALTTVPWFLQPKPDASVDDMKKSMTRNKLIAVGGVCVYSIGIIIFASSFSETRKAGRLMHVTENMSLGINDNGIGFTVSIK